MKLEFLPFNSYLEAYSIYHESLFQEPTVNDCACQLLMRATRCDFPLNESGIENIFLHRNSLSPLIWRHRCMPLDSAVKPWSIAGLGIDPNEVHTFRRMMEAEEQDQEVTQFPTTRCLGYFAKDIIAAKGHPAADGSVRLKIADIILWAHVHRAIYIRN